MTVRFTNGQIANPSGDNARNKILRAARSEGEKCIATLAAVRDDERAPTSLRVEAAFGILTLAYPQLGHAIANPGAARRVPEAA